MFPQSPNNDSTNTIYCIPQFGSWQSRNEFLQFTLVARLRCLLDVSFAALQQLHSLKKPLPNRCDIIGEETMTRRFCWYPFVPHLRKKSSCRRLSEWIMLDWIFGNHNSRMCRYEIADGQTSQMKSLYCLVSKPNMEPLTLEHRLPDGYLQQISTTTSIYLVDIVCHSSTSK